jgi:hypothetical protein
VATTSTWYYVVATKDSSTFAIYINGSLQASKPLPSFTDTNKVPLLIGANTPEGAHLDGLVDEVTVYSQALSAADIQALYNAQSAGQALPFPVTDAPLTATGNALTAGAGVPLTGTVASFTDANPNGSAADFTASIAWGDGQSSAGTVTANGQGGFNVTGTHTYANIGSYIAGIAIADRGGSTATASAPITVVGVVLSPTTLPATTIGEAGYSQTITGNGGTPPYTFAVTAGSLPPGLTLSSAGLLSGTPTAAGSYPFTITATDSTGTTGSQAYTVTVNQDSTTTANVSSSLNPSTYGQSVTFTTTVTANPPGAGTPTGTVTFLDNGTAIGTDALSGGSASFTTTTLPAGPHSISASYCGDANFEPSSGAAQGQPVDQASTNLAAVSSSASPSVFGQSILLTTTVTVVAPGAGTPTGTITFLDGSDPIGTAQLSGGSASLAIASLTIGDHSITASYGGDSNFIGSSSSAVTQTVNLDDTTTALAASLNPAPFPETVTFTATVTANSPGSGNPTGTVTFLVDGNMEPPVPLNSSSEATLPVALPIGFHTIDASCGCG